MNIELLADGVRQVNQAYIERPNLDTDDYPGMVVQYLMSALLIALGETANDFGWFSEGEYTGWLTIGDKTLLFAPTKAVVKKAPVIGLSVRQD